MLKSLQINNYAIINHLEIEFNKGLNIITGETGAGKSILLGALALILGQRAETTVLKDKEKKCVVEGFFDISKYNLRVFFDENDLEYDHQTIIRREIASNGKSRAFINDIPVNLNILKALGMKLLDIHSQHENLDLQHNDFQLNVVDVIADNHDLLNKYLQALHTLNELKEKLRMVREETSKLESEKEFFEFQFNELEKANLKEGEMEELEEELNALTHAGGIKELLGQSHHLLEEHDFNIMGNVKAVLQNLEKLSKILSHSEILKSRVESLYIELKDLSSEIESLNDKTFLDPERLETVNHRLDLIYSLQQKHRLKTISELIVLREEFKEKLENIYFSDVKIKNLEKEIQDSEQRVKSLGDELYESRKRVVPSIENEVNRLLGELGMPASGFKIQIEKTEKYTTKGCDNLQFLFSAGKNIAYQDLAKTASGGEISRLMLSIKSLITNFTDLPTIIFDEIDTGISGEIADKMGNIVKRMSENLQVINITHLPQVASKGDRHYLVHKIDGKDSTETRMKLLSDEERITEVAKMLSGAELTDAAIQNAKELLKG